MPVVNEDGAAANDSDRQRCSCLPAVCFSWGAASGSAGAAQAKRRRRRRCRRWPRLRLSSWLAWPWWFRKSGGNGDGGGDKGKTKRRRGRLLLLLTTSLQPKKALASVVSGDGALLPVPAAKVSSYGDTKKQSNRRRPPPLPVPTVDDAASGTRQPQASSTAATASTGWATAPAPSRPETTTTSQPSPMRPTDGPAGAGRTWRAPSRRRHSLRQPGDGSSRCGLWTAATTLGVVVLFGRVTAVVFLCSCLYGARFVRGWAAGGVDDGVSSSSRGFGDPAGVAAGDKVVAEMCTTATEECKKKVVMAGLLDRAGKTHHRGALMGRCK